MVDMNFFSEWLYIIAAIILLFIFAFGGFVLGVYWVIRKIWGK